MGQERFLSGKRILIVEDVMLIALDLEGVLEDLGAEVAGAAASVSEALGVLRSERVDGVLLDINLAGESAFPIFEELRRRAIPFIFMTGYDVGRLPTEYGGYPCVTKPFEYDAMEALLRVVFAGDLVAPCNAV